MQKEITEGNATKKEVAKCRGCNRALKGEPYYTGKPAYIPETNERARVNHYGGFVCSYGCDKRASMELESSMPGAGRSQSLSCYASESLRRNWNTTN